MHTYSNIHRARDVADILLTLWETTPPEPISSASGGRQIADCLIKRGLLRNWTASDRWEIDRKVFERLIQEALLVAHPRRAPTLEESWTLEPQLTEWLALVPPTPEGIQ